MGFFRWSGLGWAYETGTGGVAMIVTKGILDDDRMHDAFSDAAKKHWNILPDTGRMLPLIAHEMGHAFGHFHQETLPLTEDPDLVMGDRGPMWHLNTLGVSLFFDKLECRWFDKHYYFNDDVFIDYPPRFKEGPSYKFVEVEDTEFVEFNMSIHSQNPLHQVQLVNPYNWILLDRQTFTHDVHDEFLFIQRVKLLAKRDLLNEVFWANLVTVSALDIKGNYMSVDVPFVELENFPDAPSKPAIKLTTKWADLKR